MAENIYSNQNADCAAVIVVFFPHEPTLLRLMGKLSAQVGQLLIVDNGGADAVVDSAKNHEIPFRCIKMPRNLGVGHALNEGFKIALGAGVKYVATFDQDSDPPYDLISNLRHGHEHMESSGIACAALGPLFFDARTAEKKFYPFYSQIGGSIKTIEPSEYAGDYIKADALITSGMLVRAAVWAEGVRYDERLFVDYTDTEWCFRARAAGYSLFGSVKARMGHELSESEPLKMFGRTFFRYSPIRRYYFFRNTVYFVGLPYVAWAWKIRLLCALALRLPINILIDKRKIRSATMMIRGIYSGAIGRLGELA